MRLVFLSHDGNCTGGAQKCLVSLLKGLSQTHRDIEIHLILPRRGGDMEQLCAPYIKSCRKIDLRWWVSSTEASRIGRINFMLKSFVQVMKISLILLKIRPGRCITNTIAIPNLAFAAKLLHIPHFWFIHEIPEISWSQRFICGYRHTYSLIDRFSHGIIVPSAFTKDFYSSRNISAEKMHVLVQAVELQAPKTVTVKKDSRYTILLVGTFDAGKSQMDLIMAAELLKQSGLDFRCMLVGADSGDGTRQECDKFVSEKGLADRIEFFGYAENVSNFYSIADVLVICSKMETFGRTAAEARMFRLPIISTDRGAVREQIRDGKDGLIYRYGDVQTLAEKIRILSDPEIRHKMSCNIPHDIADKYSVSEFADNFTNIIR